MKTGFAFFLLMLGAVTVTAETVRVMTFNIWVGGEAGKQPLSQTLEVIRAAKADVAGLQETRDSRRQDNGRRLAEMLGWNYFDQGGGRAIASRYPIVTNTPQKWGAALRLASERQAWIFNAHLMHAPYQPYQLLAIPYADGRFIKTADEAVSEARKARGQQIERLVAELKPALESGDAVFLTGDFNEPSHLDWTERAARAKKCPLAVEYPTTLAITKIGMRDAFRSAFPDETADTGWTWTPITQPDDPKDRHDRIDMIFFGGGRKMVVKECRVVGEQAAFAHIVVRPYPSDHRAVVATIEVD